MAKKKLKYEMELVDTVDVSTKIPKLCDLCRKDVKNAAYKIIIEAPRYKYYYTLCRHCLNFKVFPQLENIGLFVSFKRKKE